MIEFVPATPAHCGIIACRMREWDRIECQAHGLTPKQALRLGVVGSIDVLTAKLDGRPEAMMGLSPINALTGEGAPWMLGTDAIYDHPRAMLKMGPGIIARWRDSTRSLRSVVAVENVRAIRLLRRWSFTIGDEVRMIGQVPFVSFWMEG